MKEIGGAQPSQAALHADWRTASLLRTQRLDTVNQLFDCARVQFWM